MTWRDRAACRTHENALWFPPDPEEDELPHRRETPRLYRQAKRICLACPVREECLVFALETRQAYGMWGGLTRPERNTILRERRAAAREEAAS